MGMGGVKDLCFRWTWKYVQLQKKQFCSQLSTLIFTWPNVKDIFGLKLIHICEKYFCCSLCIFLQTNRFHKAKWMHIFSSNEFYTRRWSIAMRTMKILSPYLIPKVLKSVITVNICWAICFCPWCCWCWCFLLSLMSVFAGNLGVGVYSGDCLCLSKMLKVKGVATARQNFTGQAVFCFIEILCSLLKMHFLL